MNEPQEVDSRPSRVPAGLRIGLTLLVAIVAAVLGVVVYSGITSRVRAANTLRRETFDLAVPTVTVTHPKVEPSSEELVLPGNMQAFIATPVYARTSGYLKRWSFDIGAHVKAGQLLAEIESPEVDRQLDQARAELGAAQASYDLAQATAVRFQSLLKTDAVARQEVEDRVGDAKAKKAMVESAASNVRRLEQAQAFEKVYAPFSGVITSRNTDIGALIDAGANSQGKELFTIAATDRLRVYISVPQQYSRSARPGSLADLTVPEYPGRHFHGKIARNAEAIDPASRTLLTEVDVENPTGELLPGAYVLVHFRLGSRRAVILPVNTLLFRSNGMQVAVVRGGRAVLVPITISRDFGKQVEVLDGVTTDDAVIENPPDSITDGLEVRVTRTL